MRTSLFVIASSMIAIMQPVEALCLAEDHTFGQFFRTMKKLETWQNYCHRNYDTIIEKHDELL